MFSIIEAGAGVRTGRALVAVVALLGVIIGAIAVQPPDELAGPPVARQRPDGCQRPWTAPVDAPVTDPFRPPDHRYGPGNRGIEYGTEPGQVVVAVAAGTVEFAGPVAGRPVVVIANGGELRSSYVNLEQRLVNRGETVTRGQRIAIADRRFHLGARRGGQYLDPARLIERLCAVVRLVPTG